MQEVVADCRLNDDGRMIFGVSSMHVSLNTIFKIHLLDSVRGIHVLDPWCDLSRILFCA